MLWKCAKFGSNCRSWGTPRHNAPEEHTVVVTVVAVIADDGGGGGGIRAVFFCRLTRHERGGVGS